MEAGEFEMRKVFEQTTTRNVRAILDHTNETRKLLRECEMKITTLQGTLIEQDKIISELRNSLSYIQQQLFSGGTGGNID